MCTDQWLLTHVDPTWTVVQLKQFLLTKFFADPDAVEDPRAIPVSPRKARRRSLSPITFAAPPPRKPQVASASSSDEESAFTDLSADVDGEDDVNITQLFTDAHRYKYNARPSTSSASDSVSRLLSTSEAAQDPHAYVLISFSTTQILEDRFSLSWYTISPNELLELHPASMSFASLTRCSLDAYIIPYFSARVWGLRVVPSKIDASRAFGKSRRGEEDTPGEARASGTREKGKRKVTMEWKERWAVIHQGVLSLCKDRHVSATFCLHSVRTRSGTWLQSMSGLGWTRGVDNACRPAKLSIHRSSTRHTHPSCITAPGDVVVPFLLTLMAKEMTSSELPGRSVPPTCRELSPETWRAGP